MLSTAKSSIRSTETSLTGKSIHSLHSPLAPISDLASLGHRCRYFNNINRLAERFPKAHTGSEEEVTVWCSNDYLGMGRNPIVLDTMRKTLSKYGAGAGGTRNIAGNNALHLALEDEVADLHRKPAGLVFSSCYVANDATCEFPPSQRTSNITT